MRYKVREARSSVIGWIKILGSTNSILGQEQTYYPKKYFIIGLKQIMQLLKYMYTQYHCIVSEFHFNIFKRGEI